MAISESPDTLITGTVAAISRRMRLLAVRCPDGKFTVLRFDDSWTPAIGEHVAGELTRRGMREIRIGDRTAALVDIQSFNCSAQFARDRLI